MNALLLPGNSPRHSEWIEDLKNALSSHFKSISTQHYQHWGTGDEWANIDHEIAVAHKRAGELRPYCIIAKSIGTVIAMKGTAIRMLHPEKVILLGVPISGGAKSQLFLQWLQQVDVPIIIAQNTADPLGSFADVKSTFENAGAHVTFVELTGDTHDYLDFETIASLTRQNSNDPTPSQ